MKKNPKIAIIGAGVAGATAALFLGRLGYEVSIFEREKTPVSGPPFCHLHAGGNLYREISNAQCIKLLEQSIDFARLYPFVVDYRPTLLVTPKNDPIRPQMLLPRLRRLQEHYRKLVQENPQKAVLGDPKNYFRIYDETTIKALQNKQTPQKPTSFDDWVITAVKAIDLETIAFPLILVQEFGLNLFLLAAGMRLAFDELTNITTHYETTVQNVVEKNGLWEIHFDDSTQTFDYLVNAAGFQTGTIDDMLQLSCNRFVEFKAAYVSYFEPAKSMQYPEIIFYGKRGTPQGMAQFTPYSQGFFQLHGMTKEITLFQNGLVRNPNNTCQPPLHPSFLEKIYTGWQKEEALQRTQKAIRHVVRFMPHFSHATPLATPLFGAQQIPGDDPQLRVAEVSFAKERYARCEIVKVSSVTDMVFAIINDIQKYFPQRFPSLNPYGFFDTIDPKRLTQEARDIAQQRGYPESMALRMRPSL